MIAAALAVAAMGCGDAKAVAAAQRYEAAACACTTPECAEAADDAFEAVKPSRFMRGADKAEYIRAGQHGDECSQKARTPPPGGYLCGGVAGVRCPEGYTCALPNVPDAQGHCFRKIPSDNLTPEDR